MKYFLTRLDARIALVYAFFSGLWILLSDRLLESLVTDSAVLTDMQTYKGAVFVLLSSLLIFWLLRRELNLRAITEGRVSESEERYRQLFENSIDAILLTEPGGSVHAANPAACRMFNKTEEQITQGGRGGLVDVSDPRLKPALQERARTGKFHGELTFIRADGSTFEGELSTTLFKNSKSVDLTSMIIRDVSERKQTESTLSESEERYRTLVQISSNSIFVNRQNRIEFINQAGIKLLGASSAEEVIGKSPLEIFHPDFHEVIKERIRTMLEDKKPVRLIEEQIIRLDGDIRDVEVTATPFEDRGATSIQVIMRDITERKRAREELSLSRDRLEELSRRLVEAHESESRAIGRELHDQIGQALTALKITLEMIPQLPPERSAKKMETAQGLVDELLNHVKRISLELRPPMLDDLGLIPTLLWHVNRYQEQTNIEVDFKHSGVEEKRLSPEIETTAYRVIQEALTNIARHTKTARVELQVRADEQALQIIIEDHGQGFDPQNALDRQTSIGLRGMRERVNLLGGTFHVESKINQGTVVGIEIPLSEK